jgi:UPF0755 protein
MSESQRALETQRRPAPPKALVASPAVKAEPKKGPVRRSSARKGQGRAPANPAIRLANGLLTVLAILMMVVGAAAIWYDDQLARPGPLKEARPFVVRKGEGARDIAHRLEKEGIVTNAYVFVAHYVSRTVAAWFGGKPLQIKAGDYEFPPEASITDIAEVLDDGKSVLARVRVPEGLTSFAIVEQLRKDRYLAGEIAVIPAEGTLLPETYKFGRGMQRQAFLEMLHAEQRKVLDEAWPKRKADLPLKSPEEALILASIVERETGRNDDPADIASVFVNRLKRAMPLQSDPTILYGMFGGQVQWARPIQKTEIAQRTEHNTYQIKGLPPTPICNPSRASILATLQPSTTNYLYFVAGGNGTSVFSETLDQHNAAVAKWRKIEKDIRARQAEAAKTEAAKSDPVKPVQPAAASPPVAPATAAQPAPSPVQTALPPSTSTRAVVRAAPPPGQAAAPASPVSPVAPASPVSPVAPAQPVATAGASSADPAAAQAGTAAASPPAAAAGTSEVPLPVRKPKR